MSRQMALPAPSALSVEQFCDDVGVSRTTVYRLIKSGMLKATKIRSRTVIRRVDRDAFLNLCADTPQDPRR